MVQTGLCFACLNFSVHTNGGGVVLKAPEIKVIFALSQNSFETGQERIFSLKAMRGTFC